MSGQRKMMQGRVLSDKMQRTVVVEVETLKRHRLYDKVLRLKRKYKAHDERSECKTGDVVEIMESRPLSREKRWVVTRVVKRLGQ